MNSYDQAIADGRASTEKAVLNALGEAGPMSGQDLTKALGQFRFGYRLRMTEEKGLISWTDGPEGLIGGFWSLTPKGWEELGDPDDEENGYGGFSRP